MESKKTIIEVLSQLYGKADGMGQFCNGRKQKSKVAARRFFILAIALAIIMIIEIMTGNWIHVVVSTLPLAVISALMGLLFRGYAKEMNLYTEFSDYVKDSLDLIAKIGTKPVK